MRGAAGLEDRSSRRIEARACSRRPSSSEAAVSRRTVWAPGRSPRWWAIRTRLCTLRSSVTAARGSRRRRGSRSRVTSGLPLGRTTRAPTRRGEKASPAPAAARPCAHRPASCAPGCGSAAPGCAPAGSMPPAAAPQIAMSPATSRPRGRPWRGRLGPREALVSAGSARCATTRLGQCRQTDKQPTRARLDRHVDLLAPEARDPGGRLGLRPPSGRSATGWRVVELGGGAW